MQAEARDADVDHAQVDREPDEPDRHEEDELVAGAREAPEPEDVADRRPVDEHRPGQEGNRGGREVRDADDRDLQPQQRDVDRETHGRRAEIGNQFASESHRQIMSYRPTGCVRACPDVCCNAARHAGMALDCPGGLLNRQIACPTAAHDFATLSDHRRSRVPRHQPLPIPAGTRLLRANARHCAVRLSGARTHRRHRR